MLLPGDSPLSSDVLEIGDAPGAPGSREGSPVRPAWVGRLCLRQALAGLDSLWTAGPRTPDICYVALEFRNCQQQASPRCLLARREAVGGWPCRAPQGTAGEARCACPCSHSQVSWVCHASRLQALLLTGGDHVQTEHTPPCLPRRAPLPFFQGSRLVHRRRSQT